MEISHLYKKHGFKLKYDKTIDYWRCTRVSDGMWCFLRETDVEDFHQGMLNFNIMATMTLEEKPIGPKVEE